MAAAAGSQHRCVFVGNIPYDATEEQLIQICEEVGPVVSFRLVLDRDTGKPKGYGFCEYKDEETALSARRNLQGYEINGRQLRVDFAENDKGVDRNREQGRGGPGFKPTNDAQKVLSGSPNLTDSSLNQPIGHPLAATAASTVARALGGAQTSRLPLMQNGLPIQSGFGGDPLTQYLAKMSRQQLIEIMSEMKALAVQNKALAQQLLQGFPQLPKALFQVQIMLNMVTPQMMQMATSRQSSSYVVQPGLQNSLPNQTSSLTSHNGQTLPPLPLPRPPESQMSNALLQNPAIYQQSTFPHQQLPVHLPFQHPLPPQSQTLQHVIVPGKSGTTPQPQAFGSVLNQPQVPPLPATTNLISQMQLPVPQDSRPGGGANVGQHPQPVRPDSLHQSYLSPLLTSQGGSSSYPAMPNGLNSLSKEAGRYGAVGHDLNWASSGHANSGNSGMRSAAQTEAIEVSEVMNHQSKRLKLDAGGGSYLTTTDTFSTISSVPAQPIISGSVSGSQMINPDNTQLSGQQMQLAPEVESALLQQVLNLTPEQLSSLPLEQQQQVLQLQQMLVKQNL